MGQPWNQADLQSMSIAGRAIIKVQCHSGYTYAERPTGFICLHEYYKVEEVEWQQREPQGVHFGVITKDRESFVLCYNDCKDEWSLAEA